LRLRDKSGLGALTKPAQLGLAQGAFETQQQAIVGLANIIDALVIDDDGVHQAAQVQQVVPVAIVARQARDLDAQHRADTTEPNFGDQALKAGSLGAARPGFAQILVDDNHLLPPQPSRMFSELVLTAAALVMMAHLIERRLAHIDHRQPREML
jgi:hypothetical protein